MIFMIFGIRMANKMKVEAPAKTKNHSTIVAVYSAYSGRVSCMGNKVFSNVGTTVRYLLTQMATTRNNDIAVIAFGVLSFLTPIIRIGKTK